MTLKKLIAICTLLLLLTNCNSNKNTTINNDYIAYLEHTPDTKDLTTDITFWSNKISATPNQYPYLVKRANAYTAAFSKSGNILYLVNAEKDLIEANKKTNYKNAGYLKALAHNYISQHKFKEARTLLKKAEVIGEKLNGTQKMLFDVALELGLYTEAEQYLTTLKNFSDFDFLIRLAKWEDHKGNLDHAITYMEKATKIAEASNLKGIKQWSYTNLADFYGHAGKIKQSYNHYLKALALDPNDAYAKKGIAWILYSHENKPKDALHILNHITTYYNAPDYYLLKAEIAEYTEDTELKRNAIESYRTAVANKHYGDMYNAYNIMLLSEEDMQKQKNAISIAKKEVENRPTPQAYDLLAWSYFKTNAIDKALHIVETHVDGHTYEPNVLYHIAEIYKAAGKTEKVAPLKEELTASLYELGPTMATKINQL